LLRVYVNQLNTEACQEIEGGCRSVFRQKLIANIVQVRLQLLTIIRRQTVQTLDDKFAISHTLHEGHACFFSGRKDLR
jgi:hypothetical protein